MAIEVLGPYVLTSMSLGLVIVSMRSREFWPLGCQTAWAGSHSFERKKASDRFSRHAYGGASMLHADDDRVCE
jgi:hypothetical protein